MTGRSRFTRALATSRTRPAQSRPAHDVPATGTPATRPHPRRTPLRAAAVLCAVTAAAVTSGCTAGTGPGPGGAHPGTARPLAAPTGPPAHPACGSPVITLGAARLQRVYGIAAMLAAGFSGAGTVIADIVPFRNPQISRDLAVYSRRYGLPPARVEIIDYGHAGDGGRAGPAWTTEGDDDLEMMHALAPGATLAYIEVPGSGTAELSAALAWTARQLRPDVANFSLGVAEWPGAASPANQAGLAAAARAQVTVTAGSGDTGPAEPGPGDRFLYPRPVPLWPASDPLVTAVGGTTLHLDRAGNRTRPDTVSQFSGGPASGAGLSAVFPRPAWQDSVARIVGSHRGIADISMDASDCTPVAVYDDGGWGISQGSSMASALFAGLVADAAQRAGHRLGLLGPALYSLHGTADGLLDVTSGNDSIPGMAGWWARAGYDLPTGIGTISSALPFITALATAAGGNAA
jgi:subtilase family serine protease